MAQAQVRLHHHGGIVGELGVRLELLVALASASGVQEVPSAPYTSLAITSTRSRNFISKGYRYLKLTSSLQASSTASANSRAPSPPFAQCCEAAHRAPAASAARRIRAISSFGTVHGIRCRADHRIDSRAANDAQMVQQVGKTLLQEFQILFGVFLGKRNSGSDARSAAVHLEGPDRRREYGYVWLQTAIPAFHVPEFSEADVGSESTFGRRGN